jgi:hypothetical protein
MRARSSSCLQRVPQLRQIGGRERADGRAGTAGNAAPTGWSSAGAGIPAIASSSAATCIPATGCASAATGLPPAAISAASGLPATTGVSAGRLSAASTASSPAAVLSDCARPAVCSAPTRGLLSAAETESARLAAHHPRRGGFRWRVRRHLCPGRLFTRFRV